MLFWSAVILVGIAVFVVANNIFQEEDQFKAQEKLEDSAKADIGQYGIILKYSRPFFKRYITPIVSMMKNKKKIKERYRRVIASAGISNYLTPEDFYSFKLFLIIGFPILFMAIKYFLEADWELKMMIPMAVIGYYYPNIWINGKIKQRQKDIIYNMPFAVDMLALSVEAGLDFIAAMGKVIEKATKNPLTEEFGIVTREIKIGASRAEALRNMAWRVDLIQMSSFCATLIAADSVGANIGPILKSLSAEIRQKRSSAIEKAGATAATKILLPTIFLIVPTVFIIAGVPLALQAFLGQK
ncbi:MAG: hypothetical protein A2504_16240 [Bdellovibrionales bacterium RIFOXYD12_FULL_39_22]|nr:MAG: hypothetical protein A2385_08150 [Bdellovibrionales bacterium RIFOXYB1_FULL_39_21]OFZ42971.1 MAG: hypothetical protein A2485_11075 [Bdellovibrionales bacterium RIFOXYC12_FULL_39_17]OFZ50943.1 MAG: hypothetical protein A2404_07065 [Bdellovibrionales bacterium RIFOXYC1_FULL_39_130]OFZ78166.1 MAG: hypothetical protein A2560_02235 [Bdellovibrionales bacterium RIFOXYD1_FULL_39_84]OFZ94034.1 MAG: hypothetical protein A2504_16240 [Bdellovibrionales bacterium RIFOXYD12_FULL_39_22]HLE10486.1 ty